VSLEEAFHHPRIDNSGGGTIVADEDLSSDIIEAPEQVAPTLTTKRTVFPFCLRLPGGRDAAGGMNMGCKEITSFWGDAVDEQSGCIGIPSLDYSGAVRAQS
jgi:gamma-glutamyltranspeptidase/glutathione hydrolase